MSSATGPVRPTPANLHPTIDYCVQLTLPNDREWIGAFYDALYQLTYWFAWQRDAAHTGKDIAAIWLTVLANMRPCSPVKATDGCCDGGEPLYRQNPDNPCLLESSADGVHWCTLFDVSLCTPATGQPGGGAEQPPAGGGEACYHISQSANQQALVPTLVNTGDVLTFSNFGGAAVDGSGGRWDCPTGEWFVLGNCAPGTEAYSGGTPLPSAPIMSLIAQINGTWYSCLSPITVPGGVSNAQVIIQLNDTPINDNSGDYSLDVCVTNNTAAIWESTLNFLTSPYPAAVSGGLGSWVAGVGYNGVSNGFSLYVVQLTMPVASCTITDATFTYNASAPAGPSAGLQMETDVANVGGVQAVSGGTDKVASFHGAQSGVTTFYPTLNNGETGGLITLTKLYLKGLGVKPPSLP
jgi:hypothetical protein